MLTPHERKRVRRGHRLKRLAYELASLAADARQHGIPNTANALNHAAKEVGSCGEVYLKWGTP